jgi:hypothetical protein
MKTQENDWIPAFSTDKLYLARIAVNKLNDAGIEAFLIDKTDSVLLVGEIEIFVQQDVLMKAKHLLKDLEA